MSKKLKREKIEEKESLSSLIINIQTGFIRGERIISAAKNSKGNAGNGMRAILSRVFLPVVVGQFNDRPNDCPPLVRVHDPFSFVVATIPTNHAVPSLHAPRMEKARKVFLSSFTAIRCSILCIMTLQRWIIIFRFLSQISSVESFSSRRTFSLFRLCQDFQLICRVWKMEQRSELDFRIIILGEIKILLHFETRSRITRFDERKNFHDII